MNISKIYFNIISFFKIGTQWNNGNNHNGNMALDKSFSGSTPPETKHNTIQYLFVFFTPQNKNLAG
jgi:hypothetical protein